MNFEKDVVEVAWGVNFLIFDTPDVFGEGGWNESSRDADVIDGFEEAGWNSKDIDNVEEIVFDEEDWPDIFVGERQEVD